MLDGTAQHLRHAGATHPGAAGVVDLHPGLQQHIQDAAPDRHLQALVAAAQHHLEGVLGHIRKPRRCIERLEVQILGRQVTAMPLHRLHQSLRATAPQLLARLQTGHESRHIQTSTRLVIAEQLHLRQRRQFPGESGAQTAAHAIQQTPGFAVALTPLQHRQQRRDADPPGNEAVALSLGIQREQVARRHHLQQVAFAQMRMQPGRATAAAGGQPDTQAVAVAIRGVTTQRVKPAEAIGQAQLDVRPRLPAGQLATVRIDQLDADHAQCFGAEAGDLQGHGLGRLQSGHPVLPDSHALNVLALHSLA